MLNLRIRQNVKIYDSLEDLVNDITQKVPPNVPLENVENLFFVFHSFLMVILLLSLLHNFPFRKLQAVNRRLVRWSATIVRRTLAHPRISRLFKLKTSNPSCEAVGN